jgi:signal transduction histidine kinase
MTPGTSPPPRGIASMGWTRVASGIEEASARAREYLPSFWGEAPWLARAAAGLHLGAVASLVLTAWDGPGGSEGVRLAGMAGLHLAFLMTTGTATALLALAGSHASRRKAARDLNQGTAPTGAAELMAQMSHELRTPLNAVIGFSEVMLRELHGPLGNARYQEYAHHISESGSRLLKSSEDTLAVTDAMTALMADRLHSRRERVLAGQIVREAWREASAVSGSRVRLAVRACNSCEIVCERGALGAALRHLLREAISQAPAAGSVTVTGQRRGGWRRLTIQVMPARPDGRNSANSLQVILARLLLQTQGATLRCETGAQGEWTAAIEFPPRG